jgi:hypothetical protein
MMFVALLPNADVSVAAAPLILVEPCRLKPP